MFPIHSKKNSVKTDLIYITWPLLLSLSSFPLWLAPLKAKELFPGPVYAFAFGPHTWIFVQCLSIKMYIGLHKIPIILNGQLKCQSTTKIWALFNQCNMQYAGHRSITVSFCSTLQVLFALFAPYSPISLGYKMIWYSVHISVCQYCVFRCLWVGCGLVAKVTAHLSSCGNVTAPTQCSWWSFKTLSRSFFVSTI